MDGRMEGRTERMKGRKERKKRKALVFLLTRQPIQ